MKIQYHLNTNQVLGKEQIYAIKQTLERTQQVISRIIKENYIIIIETKDETLQVKKFKNETKNS
jgi:type II secretory pathway component PulC